jgi:hypothetical protein
MVTIGYFLAEEHWGKGIASEAILEFFYNPCLPKLFLQQRIICIDGGNTIKTEGQLNALLIEGDKNGVIHISTRLLQEKCGLYFFRKKDVFLNIF